MRLFILFLFLSFAGAGAAQDRASLTNGFGPWLQQTAWPKARAAGVSRQTFEAALNGVTLRFDIPGLRAPDASSGGQSQAEFRHPSRYFRSGSLNSAASTGRQLLNRHAGLLRRIEAQTGVPGQILIAIWGRESSHGQAAIPHNAFDILASQAYMGRRGAYFLDELTAALQMVEQGYARPDQLRSSWAGALGQPQFMPSNFLSYAADGDGDGRRDIWRSEADTLASIAVYLQAHGWLAGRDWGFEVSVPSDVSCAQEGPDQGRPISDWAAMGITRVSGRDFPAAERREQGFLLMPAGRDGPAFLVTRNFYVLKDYNESDAYALFVGHVGDRIAFGSGDFSGAWAAGQAMPVSAVLAVQNALVAQGHDVGGADGLVGFKTRRSVGRWQAANGLPATCYPTPAVIRAIVN